MYSNMYACHTNYDYCSNIKWAMLNTEYNTKFKYKIPWYD